MNTVNTFIEITNVKGILFERIKCLLKAISWVDWHEQSQQRIHVQLPQISAKLFI